nr:hypothetical protein [Kibdelosporangium sp. MJ126-NF4]CEL20153.1 hypothetical protein [Kibdelosporangium sp. MJ126-NF4]CTQ97378.1 hypothetical protein [Kibdelosporangium sp. MJ126-NF4]
MRETVIRMANREAAAHVLAASTALSVRIELSVRPCPWCGADERDAAARPSALPIRGWKPGYDFAPESHGKPRLEILGCEALTARSLLCLGAAVHRYPALRHTTFRSRAVNWADLPDVGELDAAEEWVDQMLRGVPFTDTQDLQLPAASRTVVPGKPPMAPHFVTAHAGLPTLNRLYLATRMTVVRDLIDEPQPAAS